jgi:hypothetical protein
MENIMRFLFPSRPNTRLLALHLPKGGGGAELERQGRKQEDQVGGIVMITTLGGHLVRRT